MFVTTEKDITMVIIFFLSIIVPALVPAILSSGQAECVSTMEAQTNRSRSQLLLM